MCIVDWWGENAFQRAVLPPVSTNANVVGPIHNLTNKAIYYDVRDPRLFVDVWPAVEKNRAGRVVSAARHPVRGLPPQPRPQCLRYAHREARCLVSTGARQTVFRAEVAHDLGLDPNAVPAHRFQLVPVFVNDDETRPCLCAEVGIWLDLLSGSNQLVFVPALFPVQRVRDAYTGLITYRWKRGVPWVSNLGMREIINQVMLCFTPETLHILPRAPQRP